MREKVIATLLTVITALSTISPVLAAYDLGDYPSFMFDEDQNLQAYVVVGTGASGAGAAGIASDVVGAVDLAVRLAGESYDEVSAEGTVLGVEEEDVPLGTTIAGGGYLDSTLEDDDVDGLKDSKITFQDEDYDFHEEIELETTSDKLDLETSLTGDDDDYEDGIYLEAQKDSIVYKFVFDDSIVLNDTTDSDPLDMEFLDQDLRVISVDADNKFTVEVGTEQTLSVDESVTVEGKTVTLINVGSGGTVIVEVDGDRETIEQDHSETVGGIKVKPTSYFYEEAKEERMATLLIGEETTESYTDGDEYCLHLSGDAKDDCEDDPDWVWEITGLYGTSPSIGIENDFIKDDYDDNPVTVGECYTLPHDYVMVCLDTLTVDDDDYATYRLELDNVDLTDAGGGSSETVFTFDSVDEDEGITLLSSPLSGLSADTKTDTVYLDAVDADEVVMVYYVDSNNDEQFAGNVTVGSGTTDTNFAQITYDDTKATDIEIDLQGNLTASEYVYLVFDMSTGSDDDLRMQLGTDGTEFDALGVTEDESEGAELEWGTGWADLGTKDEDHRMEYGIIIKDPDTNGASDKVELEMPADQVKGTVRVYGTGGAVTEGDTIKKVVPITNAVAKLDTEVSLPVSKHLVLVGGPAANRITAQAMGYDFPTYGADLTEFGEGEAYIKVYEDVLEDGYVAVVVAGWEATDTRNACSVLQQFTTFADELDGNVAVKVTSVTAAGITAAE